MSSFVLDCVTGPPIADMKAANVSFVCRYTGYFSGYDDTHIATPQGKCLTPGEAKANSEAGISLVSNWEWDGLTPLTGYDAGVWEAQEANKIHLACGGPASRPIYFSVDTDASGEQVAPYFQGVAKAIGLPRTGAYGSYRLLKYLFDNNLIAWGWQTYAWSGILVNGQWVTQWEPRAHIQQYINNVSFSGHSVDYNRSIKSDFGQWRIGGPQIMIDLSTPGVSNYFTAAQMGWNCRQTGKNIHGEILATYQSYGNSGLNGLTHLGLPLSNEVPLDTSGAVKQYFERGCLVYDVAHKYDKPPGAGQVYTAHLYGGLGEDPLVPELQAQVAQLKTELSQTQQPTGLDPTKVQERLTAIGQIENNGNTAIQQLITQPIT